MKTNPVLPVDVASFENSCGIGVNITPDQIEDCVSTFFVDENHIAITITYNVVPFLLDMLSQLFAVDSLQSLL